MNIDSGAMPSAQPHITLKIRLTKQEYEACLRATTFRRSKLRTGLETGILLLVFVYSIIAFVMDSRAGNSGTTETLLVAISALAVLAILWLLPLFQLKQEAASLEQSDSTVRLSANDQGFVFAGNNDNLVPFDSCKAQMSGDLFVLEIGREIVGIPCRILSDEDVLFLKKKLNIQKSDIEGDRYDEHTADTQSRNS